MLTNMTVFCIKSMGKIQVGLNFFWPVVLHTFLDNSDNYRPEVLWTTWCTITQGRGGRPQNRAGDSFHCCPKRFVILYLLPNHFFSQFRSTLNLSWVDMICNCISRFNARRVTFFHNALFTHNIRKVVLPSARTFVMQNQDWNISLIDK